MPLSLRPCGTAAVWALCVALSQALAQDQHILAPDLSVILCGRNDAHAGGVTGDFGMRLRRTLLSLYFNFCVYHEAVSVEILLVDWRPPNRTERLSDLVYSWLRVQVDTESKECPPHRLPTLRIITISDRRADKALKGAGQRVQQGMLEWHCKNSGIRRAEGDMLLTVNADDVMSPELFKFLSNARKLRRDTFFMTQTIGMWLAEKAEYKDASFLDLYRGVFRQKNVLEDAKKELRHYEKFHAALRHSHELGLCEEPSPLFHSNRHLTKSFWRSFDEKAGIKFSNASLKNHEAWGLPLNFFDLYVGDFMLASRDAWHRIRGAPMPLQSICIDIVAACRLAKNLRQVVLVPPCFNLHQNHPHGMTLNKKRIDNSKKKELNHNNMGHYCMKPYEPFPSEVGMDRRQWGFPNDDFPEIRIVYTPGAGGGSLQRLALM
eukprot:TRINITY_DN91227_c0_g1_i1.p1 TRINITY_DN91227_c0_g1~~TRINITY_DN91227_c0_g1_i1.p1  ORF type:complete len:434 (+),score=76.54 TRINITY_DN91227_c0_g1_i1:140-1441(+)